RSWLTPRSNVCTSRVANARLIAYANGRDNAIAAIPARLAQRSAKLCEFQVKNPTGRSAPSSSGDPSARQDVPRAVRSAAFPSFALNGTLVMGKNYAPNRDPHKPAARVSVLAQSPWGHPEPELAYNDLQPQA